MKAPFFSIVLLFGAIDARSEAIDCKGTVYNQAIYLSTAPAAPLDQFVRRVCREGNGPPIQPLNGDFYFVAGINPSCDSLRPCDIAGSMWELQAKTGTEDGNSIRLQ